MSGQERGRKVTRGNALDAVFAAGKVGLLTAVK